ncbi:hypothetical protein LguiA_025751 [Lonicera macranthoides]
MDIQHFISIITFLVLLFFTIIKLVRILKRSKTQNSGKRLPPGPWKLPLIGNMLSLAGSLPHYALRDLAKKYGPIMHLQLGEISAIVISSPRLAKEVMKTHDLAFASRPRILASEILTYNNTDIGAAPYGDYWRQMRKICTLELLSAKKVRSFRTIREDEVWNLVDSIRSSSSTRSPVNLTEKISSWSNDIVCRATFGARCKDEDSLIKLLKEAVSLGGGFDVADLFPSFKFLHVIFGLRPKLEKLQRKLDRIYDSIFDECIKNSKGGNTGDVGEENLLQVLLRIKDGGGLEFPITLDNVKAVILDMFSAGTDTSSTTIIWAMAEMMRQPRVMEKAQAELRKALNGKEVMHEADIQGLSYLKMVIKETLRLHPPLPLILPRECREECEIDGYKIPIKTKVMINAWVLGRDPDHWDEPDIFKPERFINSSGADIVGTNYEYLPFGAGRRMCPGSTFGLANVELSLAQLLYHFNWKLPHGMSSGNLDMSETFEATSARRNNLYLVATPHTHLE